MLFIGHTRFSLLNPRSGAWKASNGVGFASASEYREYLYSDDRLQTRTNIFINESLPQIEAARGGHDVLHIVSYSDSLPSPYESALEEAARRYPFLVLDKKAAGQEASSVGAFAREAVAAGRSTGGVFGQYRLDDDDLLPATYFDRMAGYLSREHVGWVVSFGAGITGFRTGDAYYDLRRVYQPMIAIGIMYVCGADGASQITTPVVTAHNLSDRANPVILDSRSPGFFWGRSISQDTGLGHENSTKTAMIRRIRASMAGLPAIPDEDVDHLAELFPAVWHKMHREPCNSD